jgi:hypothetical protein
MVAEINVRTPVGGGSLSFPTLNLVLGLLPTQYPCTPTWLSGTPGRRSHRLPEKIILVLFCSAFRRGAVYSVEAGKGAVWLRAGGTA